MAKTNDDGEPAQILEAKESYYFPEDYDCIKMVVEWVSKQQGIICDLDLNMFCYDERVKMI